MEIKHIKYKNTNCNAEFRNYLCFIFFILAISLIQYLDTCLLATSRLLIDMASWFLCSRWKTEINAKYVPSVLPAWFYLFTSHLHAIQNTHIATFLPDLLLLGLGRLYPLDDYTTTWYPTSLLMISNLMIEPLLYSLAKMCQTNICFTLYYTL